MLALGNALVSAQLFQLFQNMSLYFCRSHPRSLMLLYLTHFYKVTCQIELQ